MPGDKFDFVSTDFEEKLIDSVRNHKCLWSKADKDFKNSKSKEAAWRLIGEELDIEATRCKQMWTPLRAQFMKFLLRLRKPSGSSGHRPFYRHENSMMFLKGDVEPEENNYSNLGLDDTSSVMDPFSPCSDVLESELVEADVNTTGTAEVVLVPQSRSTPEGRSHTKFGGKRKSEAVDKELVKLMSEPEDEFDVFGKSIAHKTRKLSNLNRRAYLEVEFQINSMLHRAEMDFTE